MSKTLVPQAFWFRLAVPCLRLEEIPQPADAADALAIAICDLHTAATIARQQAVAR